MLFVEVDFTPVLWAGWDAELLVAAAYSRRIQQFSTGPGSTSAHPLSYRVLTHSDCRTRLPRLASWYKSAELRALAERAVGTGVFSTPDEEWALNVNFLAGEGAQYEPHVDAASYTYVLFASTLPADAGGALELNMGGCWLSVQPVAGRGVIFSGAEIEHRVAPLRRDCARVTVVGTLLMPGYVRDPALDSYLFGDER